MYKFTLFRRISPQGTFLKTTRALKSIHTTVEHNEGPLSGIRILDLTRIVAGPYCTMILGDLGADVIKVEKLKTGDESRKWGPPFVGTESCYFLSLNRNKRSLCVDIKTKEGQNIIYDLAKQCDVLVENYVPGKLDEYELGYEYLNKVAPHLIYCSITGYGSEGPYSGRPGYDVIAASLGGLLHITGPQDGEPIKVGVAVTDLATGLYAHGAIMAALFKRTRTHRGQKIDCNLLSTQMACLINIGGNYLNANKEATRWGTAHESIVPYEAFPTKDGYFTVGAGSDKQFQELCERIELPELGTSEKYSTNVLRVRHRSELIGILRDRFKSKCNSEWGDAFKASSCPNGPINNLGQAFSDPHIANIGLIAELKHPTAGTIKVVGPPVRYSEGGNVVQSPPPLLGQHTDDVLTGVLGYDRNKVNALKSQQIVE